MEQKDYKAIAEIIKRKRNTFETTLAWIGFTEELADYFDTIHEHGEIIKTKDEFIKEQFLKDCGVE